MSPHRPALSVVVPAFNRAGLVRACLAALRRQTLPPDRYEVVVVDDASTDETPQVVSRLADGERVRLVRQPENRGRAAARNRGVREARAPLVVFVDSDVLVRPDFLAHHLDAHTRAGRPVLVRGPVAVIPEIPPGAGNGWLPLPPRLLAPSPAYLDTANASLPREELLAAGLFDEGFRAYGWEDVDLGFRLQRRGLPRVFRREAVAYHVQPAPTPQRFAEMARKEEERAASALRLLRKYPGWRTRFLVQQTPLHRLAYFLLAGGGVLNAATAPAVAARLRGLSLTTLEHLVLRAALNRHYLAALDRPARAAMRPDAG